jgi:hypothetical protein
MDGKWLICPCYMFPFFIEKDVQKDCHHPAWVLPFQGAEEDVSVEILPGVDQGGAAVRQTTVQAN